MLTAQIPATAHSPANTLTVTAVDLTDPKRPAVTLLSHVDGERDVTSTFYRRPLSVCWDDAYGRAALGDAHTLCAQAEADARATAADPALTLGTGR